MTKILRWKAFALSTVNLVKPNSLKEFAKYLHRETLYSTQCMHACACTHAHTHMHTHTRMHTHTHTHTYTHTHTHACTHTHSHTHTQFTYLPLLHPGVKDNCTSLSVDHLLVCVIINSCAR